MDTWEIIGLPCYGNLPRVPEVTISTQFLFNSPVPFHLVLHVLNLSSRAKLPGASHIRVEVLATPRALGATIAIACRSAAFFQNGPRSIPSWARCWFPSHPYFAWALLKAPPHCLLRVDCRGNEISMDSNWQVAIVYGVFEIVVSQNKGTPIWTPKYYSPYYRDPQKGYP